MHSRNFFKATVPFLAGKGHQWRKNRLEHSTHFHFSFTRMNIQHIWKKHSKIRLLDMSICSRAHGPSHQAIAGDSWIIPKDWYVLNGDLNKTMYLTININDSKKFFDLSTVLVMFCCVSTIISRKKTWTNQQEYIYICLYNFNHYDPIISHSE